MWSDNETDSSDTGSNESSSSESLEESFDTKKLNMKYSVERLKKKRRSKVKKKGGFIKVLEKYYTMQNALNVFSKISPVKSVKKGRLKTRPFGKKKQQGKTLSFDFFVKKSVCTSLYYI